MKDIIFDPSEQEVLRAFIFVCEEIFLESCEECNYNTPLLKKGLNSIKEKLGKIKVDLE